jgi:hypothetical protein
VIRTLHAYLTRSGDKKIKLDEKNMQLSRWSSRALNDGAVKAHKRGIYNILKIHISICMVRTEN